MNGWWWWWWCLATKLCLTLCDPIWTTACQAPLFMGFSRQECWMVAISSSGESSQPRDWTHIYFMGRQILYRWATREAPIHLWIYLSLYPSICRQTIQLTQRLMSQHGRDSEAHQGCFLSLCIPGNYFTGNTTSGFWAWLSHAARCHFYI